MIFNKNNFSILSPAIMGICNVTRDSFSDAGKNYKTSNALKSIKQMIKDGAQIIDIGAESTRPRK
jgi:Dihydropteroate synthase and related enzymes